MEELSGQLSLDNATIGAGVDISCKTLLARHEAVSPPEPDTPTDSFFHG